MSVAAPRTSAPLLVLALVTWAATTFGHKQGLEWAQQVFDWAKVPGNLHPDGGAQGMAVLEGRMALFFTGITAGVLAWIGFRLRGLRPAGRVLAEEAITWGLWAFLVLLVWKCFIVYATELIHFGQYALVGCLLQLALRRPQVAFLSAFGLGFVDELYQHYWLHVVQIGDKHWLDWSDEILDALGAVGGILPFVTLRRLRGEEAPDTSHLFRRALAGTAVCLLPLLLLDPRTSSWVLGSYPSWYPTWQEYANHKPTHWPAPRQGIPLLLASIYLLGTLVEHRRRPVGHAGLLLLAALLFLAIDPHSRRRGMPVHEDVPEVTIPRLPPGQTITVDGRLDEPAWANAARVGPLVNNKTVGQKRVLDVYATRARLLWDEQALYVAFECEDPDVWARRGATKDDPALPGDDVVELFLDDGGDEVTYVEIEVSPNNVVYDLWNFVPAAPVDHDPDCKFIGLRQWDAVGLETAVHVDGTLDLPESIATGGEQDRDRGWTVELRLPWENFRTTTTPSGTTVRRTVEPQVGERWRMNLCRVESPRSTRSEREPADAILTREQALELTGLDPEVFDQKVKDGSIATANDPVTIEKYGPTPVYGREGMVLVKYQQLQQLQAWAPTWRPDGSFHYPRFFGVAVFGE